MTTTVNTVKPLAYGQLSNAVADIIPTVTAKTIIKEMWLSNTDSASHTITLYALESGGTAAANRAVMSAVTIAANTAYRVPCSTVLEVGGKLRGLADAASKVTYYISGVEVV